jgi:hypothetical protein
MSISSGRMGRNAWAATHDAAHNDNIDSRRKIINSSFPIMAIGDSYGIASP